MNRVAVALVLAAGCGKSTDGDSGDAGGTCPSAGALSGCLLYESADCVGNEALDGLPGGWFNDDGKDLQIGLARTEQDLDIRLTVPGGSDAVDGSEFTIPTQVLVELFDRSGPDPVLYYACNGTLRITNYTPGTLLWATATFQARGPMGICGEIDYWSVGAELVNAEYCATQPN